MIFAFNQFVLLKFIDGSSSWIYHIIIYFSFKPNNPDEKKNYGID